MPLSGRRLLPREIAQIGISHWHDVELVKQVATCLSESAGSIGAWHDNLASDGTVESRDCGLMQINVPAREIGSDLERGLRTESLSEDLSRRVAVANVAAGYRLYEQPWDGRPIRRWQPWVAYTTGWATFPAFWVWHQVEGKPVGPWTATGRYLQQAICGVANYHLWIKKDRTQSQALELAAGYAAGFGVRANLTTTRGFVAFEVPARPSAPPPDGVGARPIPNDGA